MGPGRSARQDLRGARPVELREILCRVLRQDCLTIGIGMMVRRAVAAPCSLQCWTGAYNSKTSDKKHTDHDFCETLVRSVESFDTSHAREMRRQLAAPDSRPLMETVLVELEDNHKILECLEIKSPEKGRSDTANSSDKKSAK